MKFRKTGDAKSGFTLIELLVVIAIIAILAAILFPVFAPTAWYYQDVSTLEPKPNWQRRQVCRLQ